ncbi:hypothetical protein AGMMS49921_13620 [Endomicrobiia bacterium]|nr:hypothetical protein AGMMS49921_13620 [Endomicrobiia bacterium]
MRICGVCQLYDEDSLINIKDHTHIALRMRKLQTTISYRVYKRVDEGM